MIEPNVRFKRGMTLVELLVVLGVVTLLAAIILPTVKNLLADRKTSQAAIVVKNYIEAARARAIGKNRSVAVVLERVSSRAQLVGGVYVSSTANPSPTTANPADNFIPYNTCIKLSLAEEPLPISDKTIPATCTITAVASSSGLVPTNYDPDVPLLDADQLFGMSEIRVFSLTVSGGYNAAQLIGEYLVAGNEISLGDSPARFTITSPTSRASHDAYAAGVPTTIWFSVINERGVDGLGELAMRPYVDITAGTMTTEFKIFPKPKPIYSQTVQLPKGTCIDLSLSGFANDIPTAPPPGLSDYRVRFASDWVVSGTTGIPTPPELRPIYLVFSPDGSFSRVYANQRGGSQSVRIDTVEDVFLHIGRIDQVVMPVDPTVNGRNLVGFLAAEAGGTKQNLTDPSSYIIRLSPKSGAISAAPIRQFVPASGDTLGDIIGKSRQGTYNSTITGQ